MANRARGEVSIQHGRKRYTLRPTLTAYCDLEDRLDKDHAAIMVEAARGSARATRALIWAYLQAKHGAEFPALEDAGHLIDEIGLDKVQDALGALEAANKADEGDAVQSAADPPAGREGGAGSSGPRAVSA